MNRDSKHHQYSIKLLDNMDIVFRQMVSNHKDLLSATNMLLDSYETLLSVDDHSLCNSIDDEQPFLLKLIDNLHKELKTFQPKTIDNRDCLKTIHEKISNLASEIDIILRDGDQIDNLCDDDDDDDELQEEHIEQEENGDNLIRNEPSKPDEQFSPDTIPIESNLVINSVSPSPISPLKTLDDCQQESCSSSSSSSAADINLNIMTKLHRFELYQNRLQFSKCNLCNNGILPLKTYYKCTECDYILDQNCYHKKRIIWSILACKPIPKQKLSLNSNVIVLMKKCFQQIEQRGKEHRRLYNTMNNNDQEACKLLDKYLDSSNNNNNNNSTIAISKLNMNTICAMVINILKRLDDSIIPSQHWNDFAKLSGMCFPLSMKKNHIDPTHTHSSLISAGNQWTNEEKIKFIEQIIMNEMIAIHRYALAILMIHLKQLLSKNYCYYLTKQILADSLGQYLIRCPEQQTMTIINDNNKQIQIKILNIQKDILLILFDINVDFWKRFCDDR